MGKGVRKLIYIGGFPHREFTEWYMGEYHGNMGFNGIVHEI